MVMIIFFTFIVIFIVSISFFRNISTDFSWFGCLFVYFLIFLCSHGHGFHTLVFLGIWINAVALLVNQTLFIFEAAHNL